MNNQYVNHLLDEEWIIAINEIIESHPETLADVVEPELLGRFHANMGYPCEPQEYYAKLGHVEQYLWAYQDAVAAMKLVDEYADYMAEQDFVRYGGA